MIHLPVTQGTSEWQQCRIGLPTASQFDRILTPKTLRLSSQAEAYGYELLAEQLLGEPMDNATSGFMQRGSLLEQKAVLAYELTNDVETTEAGFVLRDDRRVGCSPDRFVGSNGLLEIKAPSAAVHISYLLDDDGIGYRCQVQGQLWIAEREFVDTISYNPFMPTAIVRQHRDEKFIAALATAVDQFLETMDQLKARLTAKGCVFPQSEAATARVA